MVDDESRKNFHLSALKYGALRCERTCVLAEKCQDWCNIGSTTAVITDHFKAILDVSLLFSPILIQEPFDETFRKIRLVDFLAVGFV